MPYQHRSHEERLNLIKEQQRSGLTQKAFCLSHDISLSSLQLWKRTLKNQTTVSPEHTSSPWLEIPVLPESKPRLPAPSQEWDVEVALPGGITLRIRNA
ncbi:hypothetical protein [Parendozoicomonas sp. Alg238-R29]|uniref:IS66 family insertion sequence element accessory protein TnpA n=1 Tax=Parendozoicomonas sp. Alg238-R29 TaxID=2993446 RepID=UPI00248E9F60|nr:hypothetical protein [Parendozoicomonas sp. Alg238-R29]